jgi:hypothetical protein
VQNIGTIAAAIGFLLWLYFGMCGRMVEEL